MRKRIVVLLALLAVTMFAPGAAKADFACPGIKIGPTPDLPPSSPIKNATGCLIVESYSCCPSGLTVQVRVMSQVCSQTNCPTPGTTTIGWTGVSIWNFSGPTILTLPGDGSLVRITWPPQTLGVVRVLGASGTHITKTGNQCVEIPQVGPCGP